MRGGLPLPLIPGQTAGAASPTPRGGLRRRPSPGYHPRRLPLPPTPAEGSRPLPTNRTIDGCSRHPRGRACPTPTARRPGNGCPRKPHSVSISPSVGRGAPTPPRPPAAANHNPCLPPWGKVAPQGRMRGRLPPPPFPGQPVGGGVPDALRRLPLPPIPRVTTRGDSRCRQHPRRGQDPSLRTEPLTGACVNPRAGHARPLPRNNPTHLYTT